MITECIRIIKYNLIARKVHPHILINEKMSQSNQGSMVIRAHNFFN